MTSRVVLDVMAELDGHRERFEAFCRSLTAEQLGRPVPASTWIVRDFIAHLATIDGPVGQMFEALHGGQAGSLRNPDGGSFDVDRWNDRQVEQRRDWGLEDVLAEAATQRAALRNTLLTLTDEDLERTLDFSGDGKRPPAKVQFGSYLRGWCKHDPMHAMDMSRALPERQAELAPWFDDPAVRAYQKAMNP